ncbi:unnamed protein product [Ostreobium quekettii]|uniref:1-phosphatidylinositol-3-phosphate 5-kinase n=1 Tax=Ostreobium quekettii TaxID=121088 RepID=A0A8S1J4C7_9CHLO|nr:unnamed protein product [Ostreobium quekettii]|eukprot:evm.model.scf_401.10 EVM.evm.TU.scf_401.10   scf_401:56445-72921(+)
MQSCSCEKNGERVFSVALASDGALTWDVPPPVEENGIVAPQTKGQGDGKAASKENGSIGPVEDGCLSCREGVLKQVDFTHAYEGCRAALAAAARDHLVRLVKQLLFGMCVANVEEWLPVLVDIAQNAARCLDLSAAHATGIVDPRDYVKVECVPSIHGPQHSQVIHGMVLRKNRAHRRMPFKLPNPRLLLLSGPLEFETSSSTLLQLNNAYLSRGKEYVDAVVNKIVACRPDVVLVERNVAWPAIEKLNEEGITLVYNVDNPQLEMLARCTGAEVVNLKSVSEVKQSSMGRCEEFAVIDVIRKPAVVDGRMKRPAFQPLMIFKGCEVPLVCTVVLYGDASEQMDKVARAVRQAIFAAYHMRLEAAFLADELSVASSAMAAVAEGFPVDAGLDLWQEVMHEFVCKSVSGVLDWRNSRPIHSLSPHVSGWWATEARQHIAQSRDYITPVFMGRKQVGDVEGEEEDWWEDGSDTMVGEIEPNAFEEETPPVDSQPSQKEVVPLPGCCPSPVFTREMWMNRRSRSASCLMDGPASPCHNLGPERMQSTDSAMPHEGHMARTAEQMAGCGKASTSGRQRQALCVMDKSLKFTSSVAIRNHRRGLMCEPHHLDHIDFYNSSTDMALSSFLMSIAADSERRCLHQDCHGGNSSHVRTFLHGGMRITMSVVSLPPDKELQGPGQLWFWARPKGLGKCPLGSVRRIPLSPDAMRLSFGQFLDLSCNSNFLQAFDRQLHLEFVRYFGYGRTVACVYQDRFQPYEVLIPPQELSYCNNNQLLWMMESANELMQEANEAYTAVEHALQVSQERAGDGHASRESYVHKTLVRDIHQEHTEFTDKLERIIRQARKGRIGVRSNFFNFDEVLLDCALELNGLRKDLAVNVLAWAKFMSDPTQNPPTAAAKAGDPDPDLSPALQRSAPDEYVAPHGDSASDMERRCQDSAYNDDGAREAIEPRCSGDAADGEGSIRTSTPDADSVVRSHRLGSPAGGGGSTSDLTIGSEISEMGEEEGGWVPLRSPFAAPPYLIRPFSPDGGDCRAARRGEAAVELNESFDDSGQIDHLGSGGVLRRASAVPVGEDGARKLMVRNSSASNLIDIYGSESEKFRGGEALVESSSADLGDCGEGGASHRRCSSDPFSPREEPLVHQLTRRLVSGYSGLTDVGSEVVDGGKGAGDQPQPAEIATQASNSFLSKTPRTARASEPGMVPLTVGQVFLSGRSLITAGQCTSGGDEVVIPVFDDEPGSIIAHVLASISFQKKMQQEVAAMQALHGAAEAGPDGMAHDRRCSWDGKPSSGEVPQGVLPVPSTDGAYWHPAHISQRFEDDALEMMPLSKAKFEVVAYFAPQFAKLRSRCIPGGEKSFIMSLSRCKLWKARGGKTKAYFGRTMDERYVIKGMSTTERDSFLKHLAPNYLKYIDDAIDGQREICLAKILGVFQVSLKSRTEDWERTVLIMENVFYNCTCIKKYDLKGSKRGRDNPDAERSHAKGEEAVFLDNNLRRHNLQAPPLLVDHRNLERLSEALKRDSKFLADLAIMDYSLILGLDKERTKIVVGIIDFVREYTLDKKIETIIKSSGILGEGGSEPTIISPNAYRTRFVEEIRKYFTVVPTHDDWDLAQDEGEGEPTSAGGRQESGSI